LWFAFIASIILFTCLKLFLNPDLTSGSFTHGSQRFFKFYRLPLSLLQDHGSRRVPDTPRGTRAAWSENHGRRGRYPPQVASAPHQSSDHTSAAGPALIERGQPRIGSTAARASKNAMVPSYARMALCRGLHAPSPGRFRDCSLNLSRRHGLPLNRRQQLPSPSSCSNREARGAQCAVPRTGSG